MLKYVHGVNKFYPAVERPEATQGRKGPKLGYFHLYVQNPFIGTEFIAVLHCSWRPLTRAQVLLLSMLILPMIANITN